MVQWFHIFWLTIICIYYISNSTVLILSLFSPWLLLATCASKLFLSILHALTVSCFNILASTKPLSTARPVPTNKYLFLIVFIVVASRNASHYNLKIIFKSNSKQHIILKFMCITVYSYIDSIRYRTDFSFIQIHRNSKYFQVCSQYIAHSPSVFFSYLTKKLGSILLIYPTSDILWNMILKESWSK